MNRRSAPTGAGPIASETFSAPLHNRRLVILDPKNYAKWLGEEPATPVALSAMLKPYSASRMEAFRIGPKIGNVKYDEPALNLPLPIPLKLPRNL